MAKVNLPMGITSISGKMGNVCFRTMKATGRVYVSTLPRQRRLYPTPAEREAQKLFEKRAEIVRVMRKVGTKKSMIDLWKIASQVI